MKILISQTASLGDVILSTPVISALRRNFPQAELWFLASKAGAELLKSDPELSGLISYDKKGSDSGLSGFFKKVKELKDHKFDMVFAIQRSARVSMLFYLAGIRKRIGFKSSALPFLFTKTPSRIPASHDVERNLSILSDDAAIADSDKELRLYAPERESVSPLVLEATDPASGPYLAIFPGSLWYTKRWSAGNFSELADALTRKGIRLIFLGSSDEKQLVHACAGKSRSVSLAGKTSLQDLIYVVAHSRVVVCNDSSSLHIASAFKIPTAAIFCATSPAMGFGPWRNKNCLIIEEQDLWCRPCSRHGGRFCPTGTEICMKGSSREGGASVAAAFKAVIELWG